MTIKFGTIGHHDKLLQVDFYDGGCPTRRRIDLRQTIDGTMLCIEIDEHQHKNYAKKDNDARYNDLFCHICAKFIFIRYNPDPYKINGKVINTDTKTRLACLSKEINKQIQRIKLGENKDLLEIIHLYYDE